MLTGPKTKDCGATNYQVLNLHSCCKHLEARNTTTGKHPHTIPRDCSPLAVQQAETRGVGRRHQARLFLFTLYMPCYRGSYISEVVESIHRFDSNFAISLATTLGLVSCQYLCPRPDASMSFFSVTIPRQRIIQACFQDQAPKPPTQKKAEDDPASRIIMVQRPSHIL